MMSLACLVNKNMGIISTGKIYPKNKQEGYRPEKGKSYLN